MESTSARTHPRYRCDGWTPARQRAFLDLLAQDCTIGAAARAVGLSRQTAYATRARSSEFAKAWDAALARAKTDRRAGSLSKPEVFARTMEGIATPVFYGGRQIGEVRRFDDRALFAALGRREHALGSSPPGNVSPEHRRDCA